MSGEGSINIYTLPGVRRIAGEKSLCSTGAQPGALWWPRGVGWACGGGREAHEGGHMYVHIADSLRCPAETHHCKAIILQRTKQKTQCPTAWFTFSYGSIITVTAWSTSFKPHHELLCPQTAVWITDARHDQSQHFLQSLSVTAHCPPLTSCTESNSCSRVAFLSPRDTAVRRFTKVDYQKEKAGHQRPECSQ